MAENFPKSNDEHQSIAPLVQSGGKEHFTYRRTGIRITANISLDYIVEQHLQNATCKK